MERNSEAKFKIGIPSKGYLYDGSIDMLKKWGIYYKKTPRHLITMGSTQEGSRALIAFLRPAEILNFVTAGVLDYGIVGEDLLKETQSENRSLAPLGFGKCKLTVSVPRSSSIQSLADLDQKILATSYPFSTSQYFRSLGLTVDIFYLSGSVEAAVALNLAEAISDITEQGTTIRENNLVPLSTIFNSQAVLIGNDSCDNKRLGFTMGNKVVSIEGIKL